jgi:hypothetical protein
MRCRISLLVAIVVFAVAFPTDGLLGADKGGKTKADAGSPAASNLDGLWRGFVVEGKGENPDRGQTALELTIKGNQIMARRLDGQGDALGGGYFKITPSAQVTAMDALEARNAGRPKGYQGICDLSKPDTLKWCVATPGVRRPGNFETKGNQFLLILKRQKQ